MITVTTSAKPGIHLLESNSRPQLFQWWMSWSKAPEAVALREAVELADGVPCHQNFSHVRRMTENARVVFVLWLVSELENHLDYFDRSKRLDTALRGLKARIKRRQEKKK